MLPNMIYTSTEGYRLLLDKKNIYYLKKKKYKILAAGYRCRFGEIDLIAADKQFLVFVEVKLRKNDRFAAARPGQVEKKEKKKEEMK